MANLDSVTNSNFYILNFDSYISEDSSLFFCDIYEGINNELHYYVGNEIQSVHGFSLW